MFERKVIPFKLHLDKNKWNPSFSFGYESTILKVKHRLMALCELLDDGLI
jgi:hypothetical protein